MATYQELISEVRELAQDSVEEFRFENSFYLNQLNRALQELGRIRPDAFYDLYDGNTLNVPVVKETGASAANEVDWDTELQVDMMFWSPLVAFVVGSQELTDDEFTLEGRAMVLLQSFRNSVIGI